MTYAKTVYIAGPMRGYPEYNFPLFFEMEAKLIGAGFCVVNPARMDVEIDGFDPKEGRPHQPLWYYMRRDIPALAKCDFIALLPGWEESEGVQRELTAAQWFSIPAYPVADLIDGSWKSCHSTVVALDREFCAPANDETESVLSIAARITSQERQKSYGPPKQNHERIADLWNAYVRGKYATDVGLGPDDVCWMMILVKMARDMYQPKKDNLVDTCGYAKCISQIRNYED